MVKYTNAKNLSFFAGKIAILVFFLSNSAFSQKKDSHIKLEKILQSYNAKRIVDYDVIIINTKLGCSACSESVDNFFLEEAFSPRKLFIVTSLSPKAFKIKFSKVLSKTKTSLILDDKNLCYKENLVYKIPKIIFIKNGQVVSEIETSDVKSALSNHYDR